MTERQTYYHSATRRGPTVNWAAGVVVTVWGLLLFADILGLSSKLAWLDEAWIQPVGLAVVFSTLLLRWMLLRRSGDYVELDDVSIRHVRAAGDSTQIPWTDVVDLRRTSIEGSFELVGASDGRVLPLDRGLEDYSTLMSSVASQLDQQCAQRRATGLESDPLFQAATFTRDWKAEAGFGTPWMFVLIYAVATDPSLLVLALLGVAALAAYTLRQPYKVVVDATALRLFFPFRVQQVAVSEIVECSLVSFRDDGRWVLAPALTVKSGEGIILKGFDHEAFALYDQIQRARGIGTLDQPGDLAPDRWQPKGQRRTLITAVVALLIVSQSLFASGRIMVPAAAEGIEPIVRISLLLGTDVDARDLHRRTSLYESAKYGHLHIVRRLVEEGADLHAARDHPGFTPVHVAAEYGHLEVVRYLLEAGADVDVENVWQQTPLSQLSWKAQENGPEIAALLLSHGADANSRDNQGFTPLHRAVGHGKVAFARYLASNGADVNARTDQGTTVLGYALRKEQFEVAQVLVDAGVLVDAVDPEYGKSELVDAVQDEDTAVVEFLLEHGARWDLVGNDGWSALHIAAHDDLGDYVRHMLDAGADIELPGPNGTILLEAVQNGNVEMASFLLGQGARPNALDEDGWAPLQHAAYDGSVALVTALLDNGADVNLTNDDTPWPLWWAASEGHAEVLQLLCEHGGDIHGIFRRWTPLGAAQRNGHTEVATLLRSLGALD